MTYDEKGRIAVDPARDYGENHSRQGMEAVVDGRRVIPSIMSLFLTWQKKIGSLPASSPAWSANR